MGLRSVLRLMTEAYSDMPKPKQSVSNRIQQPANDGPDAGEASGGVQSLDAALRLLRVLARCPGPMALTELARECGIPASRAHRYLASFSHAELVSQRGRLGRYELGPEAIRLGLSALARHDFVTETWAQLEELELAPHTMVFLSVWGSGGPTVIRFQRARSFIMPPVNLGSAMPALSTSTGQVFLAYNEDALTSEVVRAELERAGQHQLIFGDFDPTPEGLDALRRQIRADGYAAQGGQYVPGLYAIAAPILDWQGHAQGVVTFVSSQAELVEPEGESVGRLLQFCADRSLCVPGEENLPPATADREVRPA